MQPLKVYLVYGDKELKKCVLWILTNIMCNGEKDIEIVLKSNILCNVAISARCHDVEVRKEAFWAISGLLAQIRDKDVARVV